MPQFVGVCTPKVLKQLVERYSLYTLTLNQKDYKQDLCFKEYAPYFDEINEHMAQIERNLCIHPEAQSFWLDKNTAYCSLELRLVKVLCFTKWSVYWRRTREEMSYIIRD